MAKQTFNYREFPDPVDHAEDLEHAFGCFPALAALGFAVASALVMIGIFPGHHAGRIIAFLVSLSLSIFGWRSAVRALKRPSGIWFGGIAVLLLLAPAVVVAWGVWSRMLRW